MKPPPFDYVASAFLEQALEGTRQGASEAKLQHKAHARTAVHALVRLGAASAHGRLPLADPWGRR